jgi:hypothetical protein
MIFLDGCPSGCHTHGECRHFSDGWQCTCHNGWTGKGCDVAMEMVCDDMEDNDRGIIYRRISFLLQNLAETDIITRITGRITD